MAKKKSGAVVRTANGKKVRVDKKDMTSQYSTEADVSNALDNLTNAMDLDRTLDTSNPFNINNDYKDIVDRMDSATAAAYYRDLGQTQDTYNQKQRDTNASYDKQFRENQSLFNQKNRETQSAFNQRTRESQQAYDRAETSNYANTQSALDGIRRNLIKSASSGANVGAANATALQALLGLGQQNSATTTQGLQDLQNVSKERREALSNLAAERGEALGNIASSRQQDMSNISQERTEALRQLSDTAAATYAQNASDAINTANSAGQMIGQLATDKYNADVSGAATRAASAAEAVGNLSSAIDTNSANVGMNNGTNMTNLGIATLPQRSVNTQRGRVTNVNINRNK